jgi:hypothetical protein
MAGLTEGGSGDIEENTKRRRRVEAVQGRNLVAPTCSWMTARTETRSTAPQTNSTTPASSSAPEKDKGEGLGRIRPEKSNGTAGRVEGDGVELQLHRLGRNSSERVELALEEKEQGSTLVLWVV